MKVIAALAQKGGTGKSTVCAHLAIEAGKRQRVALIDTDPQGSLTAWHAARDDDRPVLVQGALEPALRWCRDNRIDLVLVDTAPHAATDAHRAAAAADLVIIPCRTGIFDLRAIGDTVDIAAAAGTPAVIVLNAVRPRGNITEGAREALKAYGLPICPVTLGNRVVLADALIDGRAVQELDPRGTAADEISGLWNWLKRRT